MTYPKIKVGEFLTQLLLACGKRNLVNLERQRFYLNFCNGLALAGGEAWQASWRRAFAA
jgi:hypothetical protein